MQHELVGWLCISLAIAEISRLKQGIHVRGTEFASAGKLWVLTRILCTACLSPSVSAMQVNTVWL